MTSRIICLFAFLQLAPIVCAGPGYTARARVSYAREVRQILSRNCFACHGPDEGHRLAGLRLDTYGGATKPRDGKPPVIVPGSPAKSPFVARITSTNPALRMPPEASGHRLSREDIDTLRRWVQEGARYEPHWSFVKPVQLQLPRVRDASWPRNGLDYFVLDRLARAGMKPSPEADRYSLIRRVSLDLRGLPPSPAEVDEYIQDRGPHAYERMVDRFLHDEAFGERWARMWLDLARYADSAGYGSDPLRTIWGYRNWVIDAFNRNLPFDQFTIEQIAGDLLPEPTSDQRMATAFHRNTMTNTEGGTDDEEFRVAAVKDRVDTTFQIWMGVTVGCAKCHTHKYDPITNREYYQLFAVFNQTEDTDQPDERPTVRIPWPAIDEPLHQIEEQIASLKRQLDAPHPELMAGQSRWEESTGKAAAEERQKVPAEILKIIETPEGRRSPEQKQSLARHYAGIAPALQPLRDQIAKLEKSRPEIPTLPIMQELPPDKLRPSRLLIKGNFLNAGDPVAAAVPAAFHPMSGVERIDRLALARWLVHPDNPLTARVAVNRYWAQLFGTGLVRTEEDFGTQGEWPTHPDLLDWLATEYVRLKWDTKALLRLIVTSASYRQASTVTKEHLAKDPQNRLISRGPRHRLEAEMVRDQALAVSGLLCRKIGGPSVYPPQPPNLWQAAFNGQRTWPTSAGEDRYRRGLYTFWRRTVPYPSMTTFDAPSREFCSVRRSRTNTPLQAFVTMNDPVYIEAAQALARRIVSEGGKSVDARTRLGVRLALSRPPREDQVMQLKRLYESELWHYLKDGEAAKAIATDPLGPLPKGMDPAELAAWTVVANVLLNMDGVLTKG